VLSFSDKFLLLTEGNLRILNGEQFFIEVLTLSLSPVKFSLCTETYPQFHQEGQGSFLLQASPSAPQYVHYQMPEGVDRVLIKLHSAVNEGGNLCSFLSIQSVRCPVGDLDADLRLNGRYQTVTTQGAIEVTREELNGASAFYIVVLVKPHDTDCENSQGLFSALRGRTMGKSEISQENRLKTVNITMMSSLSEGNYVVATTVPIAIFLVFVLVSIVLLQTSFAGWKAILCMDLERIILPTKEETWGMALLFEKSARGKFRTFSK
jgi:dsRNA-gated channel SID-1